MAVQESTRWIQLLPYGQEIVPGGIELAQIRGGVIMNFAPVGSAEVVTENRVGVAEQRTVVEFVETMN